MSPLPPEALETFLDAILAEDIGLGDITSAAVIPEGASLKAAMTARQDLTVAGLPIAASIFKRLDRDAQTEMPVEDGAEIAAGDVMMRVAGNARALLSGERAALNIVQHLSGIATLTRQYVEAIAGTDATLLDTRKTTPLLRQLEKYATRMGGAQNHRMGLYDAILIKDNHIAVAKGLAGSGVVEAIAAAKAASDLAVEIECDTLDQVQDALQAGADRLLLDNMSLEDLRNAVQLVGGKVKLEASGGVTLETIRAIAETGVNYISVGRITQSAPAVDIGLDYLSE
ncbi:MAG: carboxylating nicotinate-nucleotide diphosphorylase [Proteobacteria bacterium]|nr:carboxylating nicotinate-nucleotide diphosphorylase [Pseudomonadota bacterium]